MALVSVSGNDAFDFVCRFSLEVSIGSPNKRLGRRNTPYFAERLRFTRSITRRLYFNYPAPLIMPFIS